MNCLPQRNRKAGYKENFYHSLLEEVPNGVLAWNSEKRVLFVNGAALRLLGVESIIFLRQLEEQYPILKDFITHGKCGKFLSFYNLTQKNNCHYP